MEIIYKGLNPKHHYGLCILTKDGELITANGKHFQAIQIPTPHGRLIDADVFLKAFYGAKKLGTEAIKYYIDNAPTILEAEE